MEAAVEEELSKIVGLDELTSQLRKLFKGLLMDKQRRSLGLQIPRRPLHMAFLGNPGTGKSMVAQVLAKLLPKVDTLYSYYKPVSEVRRINLVDEKYSDTTTRKTQQKIYDALYGILFVNEPYSLMEDKVGQEALGAIMPHMNFPMDDVILVIFAGYIEPMQHFLSVNEVIRTGVSYTFIFDDYSCNELAKMIHFKTSKDKNSPFYGYKLHPTCSVEAIAAMIERETTEKQRKEMNGHLVDLVLAKARENLDSRMDVQCKDTDSLVTITSEDLQAGLAFVKIPKKE